MQILKSNKIRSPIHLKFVRSFPCCITQDGLNCNGTPVAAHHLTFLGGQGKGTKECDSKTVSLCAMHHYSLHAIGERMFWVGWDIDAELIANNLARRSPSKAIRNTLRENNGYEKTYY